MAHVGIERLRPRYREDDGAKRDEGGEAVIIEKAHRVDGVQRVHDDRRMIDDMHDPQYREHQEVAKHDRPEKHPNLRGSARLDRKETDQDRQRDRDDVGFETTADILQAFGGRQHRHRRSDHAVAVKERGGKNAEQNDRPGPASTARRATDQREQRQTAPLALVVGFHDRHHIFESDDQHHRPEDEAEHAIDVQLVGFDRIMAGEGFAESVERAGADIAENDADGADRQLQRAVTVMAVTRLAHFDSGGRSAFGACLTLLRLDSHWRALDQRERQE